MFDSLEKSTMEDDHLGSHPFEKVDKTTVLYSCKEFNNVRINERKCIEFMTQILYLIYQGEYFSETEATDMFFSATKLFQSNNHILRRLLYVLLKELSPMALQVFIASSCLVKDLNGNDFSRRSNATRTLFKVFDNSLISVLQRYLKESLVAQNRFVVSSALATGLHLSVIYPEITKKWNLAASAVLNNSNIGLHSYHALALLSQIRPYDRLSIQRMIEKPISHKDSFFLSLLIRISSDIIRQDPGSNESLIAFIYGMLYHPAIVVCIEASNALLEIPGVSIKQLLSILSALKGYLNSKNAIYRYSVTKVFNHIALKSPEIVSPFASQMEELITDNNSYTAFMALTIILRCSSPELIESLLIKMTSLIECLSTEMQMHAINCLRNLMLKFPEKQGVFLKLLNNILLVGKSCALKNEVICCMGDLLEENPSLSESVLLQLLGWFEDCEFAILVKQILILIGKYIKNIPNPREFIHHIFNHMSLEPPSVRSAAVSALFQIAVTVPSLRSSILALLNQSSVDSDDMVRDRALLYFEVLSSDDENFIQRFLNDTINFSKAPAVLIGNTKSKLPEGRFFSSLQGNATPSHPEAIEREPDSSIFSAPSDWISNPAATNIHAVNSHSEAISSELLQQAISSMKNIALVSELGPPSRSFDAILLTELDSDYLVHVFKHLYPTYIVLQFSILNNMSEHTLNDIHFEIDTSELAVDSVSAHPAAIAHPHQVVYSYLVMKYESEKFPMGDISCHVCFSLHLENNSSTVEPMDAYPLQSFPLDLSDFLLPYDIAKESFNTQWEHVSDQNILRQTLTLLIFNNIHEAAEHILDFFGVKNLTNLEEDESKTSLAFQMAFHVVNEADSLVFMQCRLFLTEKNEIALTMIIKGCCSELKQYLLDSLIA